MWRGLCMSKQTLRTKIHTYVVSFLLLTFYFSLLSVLMRAELQGCGYSCPDLTVSCVYTPNQSDIKTLLIKQHKSLLPLCRHIRWTSRVNVCRHFILQPVLVLWWYTSSSLLCLLLKSVNTVSWDYFQSHLHNLLDNNTIYVFGESSWHVYILISPWSRKIMRNAFKIISLLQIFSQQLR